MKTAPWLFAASAVLMLAGCGLFDSPAKQRASAEGALAEGDYGEAAVMLRSLLEGDAQNAELRLLLARALIMQGDFDGAQRTLQAAVESGAPADKVALLRMRWNLDQGNYAAAYEMAEDPGILLGDRQRAYYRARALQGMRRVPEAMAIYRELVAANPDSPDLQLRIAQCHAYLGRLDAAGASLQRAISLPGEEGEPPVKAEAWMLKGSLAERAGDMAGMQEAYREAAQAAAGELNAVQQGQLFVGAIDLALRAGDVEAARQYRSQLVRALPQSPLSRMMGAQIRLFDPDPSEAIAELQRLAQDSREPHVRVLLTAGHLLADSLEQALAEAKTLTAAGSAELNQVQELITSASSAPPRSAERAMGVSAALVAAGQPALARLVLERAASNNPDDPTLRRARVQVELRNGRVDEALLLARDLAAEQPDVPVVQALLAEAHAANRDYAAAAEIYAEIWKTSPNGPLALAFAQARRGAGLDDPERPLQQWLERQPRDTAVRLSLAAALQQEGEAEEAIREFQRVLADLPSGHPMRAIALNNLAVLYGQRGDARALETARAAHEIAASVPAIQDTYGWLLVRNGRAGEALPLLKSAAEASPDQPEIRFHYAAALVASGDRDTAAAYLGDLVDNEAEFEGRAEAERLYYTL